MSISSGLKTVLSYITEADWVVLSAVAEATPGSLSRACSTNLSHPGQVMPSTANTAVALFACEISIGLLTVCCCSQATSSKTTNRVSGISDFNNVIMCLLVRAAALPLLGIEKRVRIHGENYTSSWRR